MIDQLGPELSAIATNLRNPTAKTWHPVLCSNDKRFIFQLGNLHLLSRCKRMSGRRTDDAFGHSQFSRIKIASWAWEAGLIRSERRGVELKNST